jgi:hypothetical protein
MRTAEIDKPAFVTALMARVTSPGRKAVTFGYFEFSYFKSAAAECGNTRPPLATTAQRCRLICLNLPIVGAIHLMD